MDRDQKMQALSSVRIARAILAATLLLGLVAGSIPFAVVSSASSCQLACCAGRPRHAAGSCMGDSCRAGLHTHGQATHHPVKHTVEVEDLCGATHATSTAASLQLSAVAMVGAGSTEDSHSHQSVGPRVDQRKPGEPETAMSAVVAAPCRRDCGSTPASTRNKKQNAAKLSQAIRLQPPPTSIHLRTGDSSVSKSDHLRRLVHPRAPPIPLS